MYIYVAASWRTERQPLVVRTLREAGYDVYDFHNPKEGDNGFHWSEIDPNWVTWNPFEYRQALDHKMAIAGFKSDMDALRRCDVAIGVQPFGRSASMEMGWAAGNGKKTILLLAPGEPELMVKMFDIICCTMSELLVALRDFEYRR